MADLMLEKNKIPPAFRGERLRWKLPPAPGTGEQQAMVTLFVDYGADGPMDRTKAIITKTHADELVRKLYEIIDAEA